MSNASETSRDPVPAMPVIPPLSDKRTLGAHLDELRARLILCLLVFVIAFACLLAIYPTIWNGARLPILWACDAINASRALGAQVHPDDLVRFQFLGPTQGFVTIVWLIGALSFALTLPVLAAQAWQFVNPGLRPEERGALGFIFGSGALLFFCGGAVAFRWGVPFALEWLLGFNADLAGAVNVWTPAHYFDFLILACFGFGVCFELPLAMMALAWAGLLRPEQVRAHWRYAALVIVVLGALLTPPDPVTQILLASLLCVLFGIGYLGVCYAAGDREPD